MTEEELLSKETFINLFSKNEIERIEQENKLYLQAKELGVLKQFKSSLKKYEELLKDKIVLDNSLKLPKCDYDIENYNMGKYICNINGITDSKSDYKFSFFPILPVERYINQETGKEKVKIIFYKENKWQERIVDKSQLSSTQKLLILSDYGLDVTSENAKYYVNYFNEILNLNDIKKLESVSHLGWSGKSFIPYDSYGIFDGADENASIYKAISTKGNCEKWKEVVYKLRDHKIIKVLMAVTLASPLLEIIGVPPYMVNLWSSMSGNGKTLSCMIAMSIWGNPEAGALRLSSNNTQNYYIAVASFLRNITCYFDELQIVKHSKNLDLESLIMDLCNGTEKGRLNKNSQTKEIKNWYNNFLFTSNDSLVKENAGEQLYNRVVDIEINEKLIDGNGYEIANVIKNNYGFAGKEYISYLHKIGDDGIKRRFKNFYDELVIQRNITDKQAGVLASILVANQIGNECIFEDDYVLDVADICDYINDKNEIKTSIKAKKYIIDIINANKKKFEDNYGEIWGRFKEIGGYKFCYINSQMLFRELAKGGFEFNTVKKEWADMKFLRKNSQDKYVLQTTVDGQKGGYVVLDLNI